MEKNFLEMVPKKNPNLSWIEIDEKRVQIIIERNSIAEKIARKFFKIPKKAKIDLDEVWSFVWKNIDGKENIFSISKKMKENFGEKIEPVNDRLIQYVRILKNNKFIDIF